MILLKLANPNSPFSSAKQAAASLLLCLSVMLSPALYAQSELEPGLGIQVEANIEAQSEDVTTDADEIELSEEEKAALQARAREISQELAARQASIQNLQSEFGVYSSFLQEAYLDLAAFYAEIEDHESASRIYNDALQVTRINTGLYSELQRPIIDSIIASQSKMDAWEEVDKLKDLDLFVAQRAYEPGDVDYRLAIESYGEWKLRVVRENILQSNSSGLLAAASELSRFYGREIEKIELQSKEDPVALLDLIQGKTRTDLSVARSISRTPYVAFTGTASRYITQSRCANRRNAAGQVVRQCTNVQVENPRYRDSQRDAKNMAIRRYTTQIQASIERLRRIRVSSESLTEAEKLGLDSRIAELETESLQLARSGRRLFTL